MPELREQPLEWPRSIEAVVQELGAASEIAWLDSSDEGWLRGAVAVDPVGVLTFRPAEGARFASNHGERRGSDVWALWRSITRELGIDSTHSRWIGYVGYEMARTLERNRIQLAQETSLPWLRMGLFDHAVTLDERSKSARLDWSPELTETFGRSSADIDEFVRRWNAAAASDRHRKSIVRPVQIIEQTPRKAHLDAVARAKEYIAAGDIYQVNLAQRFELGPIDDPIAAYLAIRHSNPARLGALLKWDEGAVASVSPEYFLTLSARGVRTSPIKGTRPRSGDARLDAVARDELLASEKDAAELAMIIDLHRNDLGRVCEWGSVRVRNARRVEEHPTVFHTVADIDGTLAGGRDAFDLIKACFPAGSVTGAPKIRAMEIISELERAPRGVYTGAIGAVTSSGGLVLNVAIRTLQIHDGIGTLHSGGGIVADSDPDAEYDETIAKARGILGGLGVSV